MKTIEVTKLEKKVLEAMAEGMYAEFGFSDYGLPELIDDTKLSARILRGVGGSLVKKDLIYIDDREDEGYKNNPSMHIWYLHDGMEALVEEWRKELNMEQIKLVIK